jgi:hypothetical protein
MGYPSPRFSCKVFKGFGLGSDFDFCVGKVFILLAISLEC